MMTRRVIERSVVLASFLGVWLGGPSPAPAQGDAPASGDSTQSAFDLDPLPHGVATLALYSTLFIYQNVVRSTLRGGLVCGTTAAPTRCDPARLNGIDRAVIGNDSEIWRRSSDVTAGLLILGAAAGAFLNNIDAPRGELVKDIVVMAEATAAAMAVIYVLKLAVRRPRPSHYTAGQSVATLEQQLSFPSGHAGFAAAMGTAYATSFHLRYPDSPYRFAVDAVAAALVLLTGYGRIGGGRHFYSDVLAGVLIGGAAGFVVPYLHRAKRTSTTSVRPFVSKNGVGVAGSF